MNFLKIIELTKKICYILIILNNKRRRTTINTPISNTSERLRYLMELYNWKQKDILDKVEPVSQKYGIKMNKSDISQYVSGKVKPSQDKLTVLGEALNVNEIWLMGYDAKMNCNDSHNDFYDNINLDSPEIDAELSNLTLRQKRICLMIKNLTPNQLNSISDFAQFLLSKNK